MLDGIPSVRLSAEREAECLAIMRRGNSLRNEYAAYLGPKCRRKMRNLVVRLKTKKGTNKDHWPSLVTAAANPSKSTESLCVLVDAVQHCVPKSKLGKFAVDWPAIAAVMDVEWDMTCSYVDLARDQAYKWAMVSNSIIMLQEPAVYGQEAWIGLRNAIYGYVREGIAFSTYLTPTISRHLMTVYNSACPSRYFTREEKRLLRQFKHYRMKLDERLTLDEVARRMGLDDEQALIISRMLTKIINYSQIGPGQDRSRLDEYDNDITSLRHGAATDRTDQPEMLAQSPLRDKIKQAGLTPFEEELFLTSLPGSDYYGWQTDIAAKHKNPRTGQPYSRAAAGLALESAKKKLRRVVRHNPFEDD